jgi:uncharacterized surface anchored protein
MTKVKIARLVTVAIYFAAVLAIFISPAKADEHNKLTVFTFSAPIELPGVTLPGGTYAFKLADSQGSRNIVQVWNKNMSRLYATILAIADYNPEPSEKTVIRFSESAAGGPPAVKEWFYPGEQYGLEFVYPKSRATELAKAANQPVPSIPQNIAKNATKVDNSPIKAQKPSGEEVEVAEVFVIAPPSQQADQSAIHKVNSEDTNTTSNELPKTASMFPVLWITGMALLTAGALLGLIARREVQTIGNRGRG